MYENTHQNISAIVHDSIRQYQQKNCSVFARKNLVVWNGLLKQKLSRLGFD